MKKELRFRQIHLDFHTSPAIDGIGSKFDKKHWQDSLRLTEEAAQLFPDADGMFFDIISQAPCCCTKCMKDMLREGYNPEKEEERKIFARNVLLKYHEKVTATAKSVNPDINVFHNSVMTFPGHWGMNTFPETSKHWTQTYPIEIIEDLNPVYDSEFFFSLP